MSVFSIKIIFTASKNAECFVKKKRFLTSKESSYSWIFFLLREIFFFWLSGTNFIMYIIHGSRITLEFGKKYILFFFREILCLGKTRSKRGRENDWHLKLSSERVVYLNKKKVSSDLLRDLNSPRGISLLCANKNNNFYWKYILNCGWKIFFLLLKRLKEWEIV